MIDPAKLAFDIDGVIADTMSLFLQIVRDRFKINTIRYEDITCYNLADCLELDPQIIEDVVERILDGDYRFPLKPFEGAAEVLTRIGRYHNPVLFVTARPYAGPIWDWIQELLDLEAGCIDVVATGCSEDKAAVLLKRDITCFVDDRLDTCYQLQDAGMLPILFKQPWNRDSHPFVEVGSWKELEVLIDF